ncbi:MAG TPA: quinolinate synthase NadA [Candidatus Thermoplasmatota archaeon]|jgi:quinolinate synthase|nr:quinolinate synthase NadA [Candidatus Thermoplasmatota archaeon]
MAAKDLPLHVRVPPVTPAPPPNVAELQARVRALKAEKGAVILAHNYQVPEVQDVADFVGDSLGLSQQAAKTDADLIVFCGVHFMAETAAILCPDKTVLLPDLEAGCSLAASITADDVRAWKAEHPGAVAVGYVNTTAEVKAELDYCCTSANALRVLKAIPAEREVLFLPDFFLGMYLRKETGRANMRIWQGECHVHAGIRPADLLALQAAHPDAELLVHPECGCSTNVMAAMASGALPRTNTRFLSTEGMVRRAAESPAKEFIVATEVGILPRMRAQHPDKAFFAASERAVCQYMKRITLEKVVASLEQGVHRITVPPETARRARGAIERMLAVG